MIDVLALPFDQYQRYRLVTELVEELRKPKQRLAILDVGGRTALLRSFLPHDAITLVDLEPSEERPLVLGDGSKLPFADKSFDLVLAFDTLEHVPVKSRSAFVRECARVTRGHVVLAGPCQSPEVEEAEKLLQQFLKDKLGVEHRYLEEHRHNGLPDRAAVERELTALGARVTSFGHGNLDRWLGLICLSMYMDYRPELRSIAARFHRFYNARLYESDHTPPVYRHAIVAAFAGAELPRGARFGTPASAPPGGLRRIEELAFELVAFERAQAELSKERSELERGLAELRVDLEGHRRVLAEALAQNTQQTEVIATLERDLAEHQRSLGDLERDLAAQHERFAEAERGHALAREALETDLAGHKELVRELEEDLASHQKVLAEVRELADGFERELESLRALLERERGETAGMRAELELRIAEQREVLATVTADLAAHRATLADERAERAAEERALRAAIAEVEHDRDERGKVIAALETDLSAHRTALAELEREVNARGAAITALENDVAAHGVALASVRGELAEHRAVLADRERELAEHKTVVRTLEEDLAGHRTVVATLREEAAALRAGLEERTHAHNQTTLALADAQAQIANAAAALRAQHETLEVLRAELRSRWRGFKRAFWKRKPIP